MKLIVHELEASGLVQEFTTPDDRPRKIVAIRPHLYRHNFASGSLKIQLLDESDVLITESESIDISDIGSMAFFHGYVRFYIDAYLEVSTTYKIKLVGEDGYSFSEPAYVGWVNGADLGKYAIDGIPNGMLGYPNDFEIWEEKR